MDCPTDRLIEHIGDRWVLHLLHHLIDRAQRTQGLLQELRGISSRTLAAKLKMLEADGWIVRRVYPEVPPHVEYELSERGKALIPLLAAWIETGRVLFPTSEPECVHCQHLASAEAQPIGRDSRPVTALGPKTRLSRPVAVSAESIAPAHEFISPDDEVILL